MLVRMAEIQIENPPAQVENPVNQEENESQHGDPNHPRTLRQFMNPTR